MRRHDLHVMPAVMHLARPHRGDGRYAGGLRLVVVAPELYPHFLTWTKDDTRSSRHARLGMIEYTLRGVRPPWQEIFGPHEPHSGSLLRDA